MVFVTQLIITGATKVRIMQKFVQFNNNIFKYFHLSGGFQMVKQFPPDV